MNVEHIETGELTRKLTIEIGPEDYAEALRKRLNARKREAEFRGFRKGMAPLALVKRVYGDQCLVDSVNDIISGQLDKYVKDNNLRLLGEPLSSEDQPQLDWQDGNSFTFKFDLGLRPQLSFEVGKEDKVPYYDINITKEAVSEMKKNILRQFGSLEEGKKAGKDDYVICDFSNAAGHKVEGVYVTVRNAEGEAHDFLPRPTRTLSTRHSERTRSTMTKNSRRRLKSSSPAITLKKPTTGSLLTCASSSSRNPQLSFLRTSSASGSTKSTPRPTRRLSSASSRPSCMTSSGSLSATT